MDESPNGGVDGAAETPNDAEPPVILAHETESNYVADGGGGGLGGEAVAATGVAEEVAAVSGGEGIQNVGDGGGLGGAAGEETTILQGRNSIKFRQSLQGAPRQSEKGKPAGKRQRFFFFSVNDSLKALNSHPFRFVLVNFLRAEE